MKWLYNTNVAKHIFHRYFNIPLTSTVVSVGKDNIHFTEDFETFKCRQWQVSLWDFEPFKTVLRLAFIPMLYFSKGIAFVLSTDNTATNNKDAPITVAAATTNFGTATDGFVASQAAAGDERWRLLLHFTLPSGSGTISNITLNLYKKGGAGTNTGIYVEVHELTRTTWTEAGVTWNKYDGTNNWTTAGGDYSSTVVDSLAHTTSSSVWRTWDLIGAGATNPISGLTWASNVHLILRFDVENSNPNQYETYSTKEEASNKPYIEITYSAASGPANMKSYNTNTKSNIKSINSNLIANVKSFDTNA